MLCTFWEGKLQAPSSKLELELPSCPSQCREAFCGQELFTSKKIANNPSGTGCSPLSQVRGTGSLSVHGTTVCLYVLYDIT